MNSTQFVVTPTLLAWLAGGGVVALVLVLALVACRRQKWRAPALLLEGLRVLLVALCALLLFRPELRTVVEPPSRGTLAILVDRTGSMATEDVVEAGGRTASRKDWVDRLLEEQPWQALGERFDLQVAEFSDSTERDGDDPGSDYNRALDQLAETRPDLRAVLLVGDGDSNAGATPLEAASRLAQRQVVLNGVVVGAPQRLPDLELLRVDAPAFTIVGDRTQLPFRIRNSMDHEVRTEVELMQDGAVIGTHALVLPPYAEIDDSIYWKPEVEGQQSLSLRVPVQPGELLPGNNERAFELSARPQSIKVLVIETAPRWEYRYMRNAFSRDPGVEVDCLLFHPDANLGMGGGPHYIPAFPATIEQLSTYDVIVLGDVPMDDRHLTREQCGQLRDLVQKQASGLVFLPGPKGHLLTHLDGPLGELLPVVLDASTPEGFSASSPSNFTLTDSGSRSLLTMLADAEQDNPAVWRNLPGFYWWAPVEKAIGGSEVLAVHDSRSNAYGRIPLIVARQAERGKVLFMATDGAWRWRRGVEDKYHYRFWGQVARWMSYQRQMASGEYLRVYYRPENPAPGEVVTLQANAFDAGGVPLAEGSVDIELTEPGGEVRRFRLDGPDAEGNGSFAGQFTIQRRGEYRLVATCPENGDRVEVVFGVAGQPREQIGQPARPQVLEELARITGGEVVAPDGLAAVLQQLQNLPRPRPEVSIERLWASPLALGILVGGFALFWILRKLNGQF